MSYNVVSFSGGKDSTCLLLMMLERGVQVDEIVFFDTGWEFPQMYEHIEKVEAYTGRKITVLQDSVGPLTERMLNNHRTRGARVNLAAGMGWPGPTMRWCTTQKVAAIKKHLASHENVVQFVGIAADEPQRVRGERYPLVEWGITEADALSYCYEHGFDWGGVVRALQARFMLLLPAPIHCRAARAAPLPPGAVAADDGLGFADCNAGRTAKAIPQ